MNSENNYSFKIFVVGDKLVGKTSCKVILIIILMKI